jgi:hypothetical protein
MLPFPSSSALAHPVWKARAESCQGGHRKKARAPPFDVFQKSWPHDLSSLDVRRLRWDFHDGGVTPI